MRSDTEVVLGYSVTAPLHLKRKPQLLVLLSRVAEASLLEEQDLSTIWSGGVKHPGDTL